MRCSVLSPVRLVRRRAHLLLALAVFSTEPLAAQFGLSGSKSPADSSPTETVSPASPRAALTNFLRHANAGDWAGAADYLSVPAAQRDRAPLLARRLKTVIDQRLVLDPRELSPLAVGDTADGDRSGDRIAVVTGAGGREEPLRLIKVAGPPARWVFSQATVGNIDALYETLGSPWLRDRLPQALLRIGPLNVYWWQWIGLAILLPVLVLVAWGLGATLRLLLGRIARATVTDWDDLLLENLRGPFRLWAAAIAAQPLLSFLQLNPRVAGFVGATARGLGLIALFWGLLRIVRLVQTRLEQAEWAAASGAQARTLVPLLSNILRVALAIVALLVALAQFGYPVGTLLAGLGIGGIAVALAAQKTVENLFGSVSLAADRAFRVGDWVRAGPTEGEVERIGLRSTSVRTLDRTVVRIPNGLLADDRIETFGERDRFVMRADLDVTYETTPEQLDKIRNDVLAALQAHPMIWPDRIRVHVVLFAESAIRINVTAWFLTTDLMTFLEIRHGLFLQFMRIVRDNGSSFAFPSRTIYHVGQNGTSLPPGDD